MTSILNIQSLNEANPLWLVGCGKMGGALLKGWLKGGLDAKAVNIIDPLAHETCPKEIRAEQCYDSIDVLEGKIPPKIIILAIKPQVMPKILRQLKNKLDQNCLVISIAAGTTFAQIAEAVPDGCPIVRAMPNIASSVGHGVTALFANAGANDDDKKLSAHIFEATGQVVWLANEDEFDVVTALSGSGPAYVFYLCEAMSAAAIKCGLSPDVAARLARETVVGAGVMLGQSSLAVDDLREQVTSPNGTTEAALNILMAENGLGQLMAMAIEKARERSQELAGKI